MVGLIFIFTFVISFKINRYLGDWLEQDLANDFEAFTIIGESREHKIEREFTLKRYLLKGIVSPSDSVNDGSLEEYIAQHQLYASRVIYEPKKVGRLAARDCTFSAALTAFIIVSPIYVLLLEGGDEGVYYLISMLIFLCWTGVFLKSKAESKLLHIPLYILSIPGSLLLSLLSLLAMLIASLGYIAGPLDDISHDPYWRKEKGKWMYIGRGNSVKQD